MSNFVIGAPAIGFGTRSGDVIVGDHARMRKDNNTGAIIGIAAAVTISVGLYLWFTFRYFALRVAVVVVSALLLYANQQ
jgi:hypothetical protein